jgi:hypothetical protein
MAANTVIWMAVLMATVSGEATEDSGVRTYTTKSLCNEATEVFSKKHGLPKTKCAGILRRNYEAALMNQESTLDVTGLISNGQRANR